MHLERDPDEERYWLAVVAARFAFGAAAGLGLWFVWVIAMIESLGASRGNMYHGTYPDWPLSLRACVTCVLLCGAVGVLWPRIAMGARAVLSHLPFFDRYDWE